MNMETVSLRSFSLRSRFLMDTNVCIDTCIEVLTVKVAIYAPISGVSHCGNFGKPRDTGHSNSKLTQHALLLLRGNPKFRFGGPPERKPLHHGRELTKRCAEDCSLSTFDSATKTELYLCFTFTASLCYDHRLSHGQNCN